MRVTIDAHYYLSEALDIFHAAGYDFTDRQRFPFNYYWNISHELAHWPVRLEPLLNPERRTWQHVIDQIYQHSMVSPCFPKPQIELFIHVNQSGNLAADWCPPGGWTYRRGHE